MTAPVAPVPIGRGMRIARVVLIAGGIALLVVAAVVLVNDTRPRSWPGILAWLVGALILHDGIIAPGILAVSLVARRRRWPGAVLAIVQGALVLIGVMALLVVPEILKQRMRVASSSILPLDYATHLVVYVVAIAVLAGIAIALYVALARSARRSTANTRPPSSQS